MWTYYIPFVFMNDGPQFGYQTIERSTPISAGDDINEVIAHLVRCINMPNVTTVVPLEICLLSEPQDSPTVEDWIVRRQVAQQ